MQFSGGTGRAARRIRNQKLRSFWEELAGSLAIGCWVTRSRNCAIPKGNMQSAAGSLAAETTQFLEGTGCLLLGAAVKENCTGVDRLIR